MQEWGRESEGEGKKVAGREKEEEGRSTPRTKILATAFQELTSNDVAKRKERVAVLKPQFSFIDDEVTTEHWNTNVCIVGKSYQKSTFCPASRADRLGIRVG